MEFKINKPKGYLVIVAIILIVIVSFIAILLGYMLAGSVKSSTNMSQANSALYIAKSGLELAENTILNSTNSNVCSPYNVAATALFNGEYSVTGYDNTVTTNTLPTSGGPFAVASNIPLANSQPTTNLNSGISANATIGIRINSKTGFSPDGLIQIQNELIYYTSISGSSSPYTLNGVVRGAAGTIAAAHTTAPIVTGGFSPNGVVKIENELISYSGISTAPSGCSAHGCLTNAIRGIGGTTATSHPNSAAITQNECILTSTGAVPTLANPQGKRTLQQILFSNISSSGNGFNVGGYTPEASFLGQIMLNAPVNVSNTSASCPSPASVSSPYAGTTMVTAYNGNITANSGAYTSINGSICSNNGTPPTNFDVLSSNIPGIINTVTPALGALTNSYPTATSTSLWNSYFTNTVANVLSSASSTVTLPSVLTSNTITGNTGSVIVLNTTGNMTTNGCCINLTIGSVSAPVIAILNLGSNTLTLNSGNTSSNRNVINVYGLLYIRSSNGTNNGTVILNQYTALNVYGAMAEESGITLNSNSSLNLDPTLLATLAGSNPNLDLAGGYLHTPFASRELFY